MRRHNSTSVALAYFVTWGLHFVSCCIVIALSFSGDWIPSLVVAIGLISIASTSKNLNDSLLIFTASQVLYLLLPSISHDYGDGMKYFGAKFEYGYIIANLALSATLLSASVFHLNFTYARTENLHLESAPHVVVSTAKVSAIISITLSALNIAINGSTAFGSITYADSFSNRLSAGTGVFFLAVPFALVSFAILQTAKFNKNFYTHTLMYTPFILLFISTSQRKYIIIPFLFVALTRKNIKISHLTTVTISAALVYMVFLFLGYMRINEIPFSILTLPNDISNFLSLIDIYIEGEAGILMAILNLSCSGAIDSIGRGVYDYIGAPLMILPNFIFGSAFVPLNVRFAFLVTPSAAAKGAGWGFPYFGEAFLFGGEIGVVIIAALTSGFFFALTKRARRSGQHFAKALSLINCYLALWTVRNSFAYIFKDFTYICGALFISYLIANLLRGASRSRKPLRKTD